MKTAEVIDDMIENEKRLRSGRQNNNFPPHEIKECSVVIQALTELKSKIEDDRWVSVKDKLPESGKCVMIYSENGGVAEGSYSGSKGRFEQWRWNTGLLIVTHWMPLPEPPCKS